MPVPDDPISLWKGELADWRRSHHGRGEYVALDVTKPDEERNLEIDKEHVYVAKEIFSTFSIFSNI